ncbi:hypothetical protein F5Y15DRAFT_211425 [Xylariaceae sp. FL0016]|nr:hypothetical protein F5Y15DRAFT_211425 [Xylariaceae sp. FL0016]
MTASSRSSSMADKRVEQPWADGPWPLIETPARTQSITHPATHIANDFANVHNAMLRGLNAMFWQAPHVHEPADVADLLFLLHSWGGWVLDHHVMKEDSMLPGFEGVLGLEAGTLTRTRKRNGDRNSAPTSDHARSLSPDTPPSRWLSPKREQRRSGPSDPEARDELAALLRQSRAYAAATREDVRSYASGPLQGLLALLAEALVPHLHAQIPLLMSMRELCRRSSPPSAAVPPPPQGGRRASGHLGAAASEFEAQGRANQLMKFYIGAESRFSDALDPFVVPPMVIRLRDITYEGMDIKRSLVGAGGGGGDSWPRLSVLAVHAVADKLSPRHAGAWRFLPCDVWGRPRELEFLGPGSG